MNDMNADKIRGLMDGTTEGPWDVDLKFPCVFQIRYDLVVARMSPASLFPGHFMEQQADMCLIAALPDIAKFALQRDEECKRLEARVKELEHLLHRYRKETPLGHQPHMIAHEVDALLENDKENG